MQPSQKSNPLLRNLLTASLGVALVLPASGCGRSGSGGTQRWVTTQNANVDIDWDAVGKAYKAAEGPEDFERRVNEIYTGSELISISVQDEDAKRQVVTGFFDKNSSGAPDEGEKIFGITREITGEGSGQYQMQGYGHYSHYRSPMWDIASGMMLGSMLSRAFSPSYRPMYVQPYRTPVSRHAAMRSSRSNYRAANPQKFTRKGSASRSGRSYGRSERGFGGRRSRPRTRVRRGGRFGVQDHGRTRTRLRLG